MSTQVAQPGPLPSQAPLSGLVYGTVFFAILAIVGCIGANFIVGRKSRDRLSKFENRR